MINSTLGWILLLFLSASGTIKTAVADDGFRQCESIVKNWAFSSINSEVRNDKHRLGDLLFFLHIPRTGGRTYFHCFLRKLYVQSLECPRSYDKLRYDARKSNCRLLSTHDDYSMISKLPKEKTSVVTVLRNPVDRVFSTYEFSVEVAARFLIHPNLTSAAKRARVTQSARNTSTVSTLDIWPWKYLVPWMREDLFARRDARKLRGESHLETNNPYDMEDMVMPMHDYINNPIAQDIIHNGATFQIAGLTNNSYSLEAPDVRRCVLKHPTLGKYVLKVAKRRLDKMLYVGLTDHHKDSAVMFGNIVGAQVISQLALSNSTTDVTEERPLPSKKADSNDQGNGTSQTVNRVPSSEKDGAPQNKLTVEKLMEAYESCVPSLRKVQADRRINSLKQISPANFSKESRRQVPVELIQEIESLNRLDIELYNFAQNIFKKQQAQMMPSLVYDSTLASIVSLSAFLTVVDSLTWEFLSLCAAAVLILPIFFLVNSRRRRSKVKL